MHDALINAILASPCHIIATMRSKTETVLNPENRQVQKVGLTPVQRDNVEYEFTTVLDISQNHLASVSKDRTGVFQDTPFMITPKIGARLLEWLNADGNSTKGGEA